MADRAKVPQVVCLGEGSAWRRRGRDCVSSLVSPHYRNEACAIHVLGVALPSAAVLAASRRPVRFRLDLPALEAIDQLGQVGRLACLADKRVAQELLG